MDPSQIIESSLYFLALINPVSKVLFITSKHPAYSRQELIYISMRSSTIAFLILATLSSIGGFLFIKVFHVEIYSLCVAGGIILFIVGLNAVRKGSFFEDSNDNINSSDVSIVPLATPLIAGAGTMSASISFSLMNGIITTIICITNAILINLVCMLLSFQISRTLEKLNATEPLTRITGLIITAVAMQMIFSGCTTWVNKF